MFSKNIVLLLCVVCFIVKNSTADDEKIADETSTVIKGTNLIDFGTVQWQELFNKYDIITDSEGSISTEDLQKLVFKEFNGVLTVRQAKTYIHLINLKQSYRIGLEQLDKMKPIIFALSQREMSVEYNDEDEITRGYFVSEITEGFKKLFSNKKEVLEVLDLLNVQNESFPMQSTKYEEIVRMLFASVKVENIYKGFCKGDFNKNGVINYDDLVKAVGDPNKADLIMKKRDYNRDGVIDLNEYMIMACNDDMVFSKPHIAVF
ncbi:uncharacterized protein LOC126838537 [Adelges cooleyi]|uniref:uncharacterized protein LOC126838537 n=1 Tax=Adelges cooleyi TaxID=133065 RepID=UPI0021803B5D|nr:uncharacterized protein LOC126838537 [Adelges cooleyi]